MGLKKVILMRALENQRNKRTRLQDQIDRFDRQCPRWQYSDAERAHLLEQLNKKLERQDAVLAELRRYIEPGA